MNVCSFTVAVNRPKVDGKEQEADFFNVSAWRQKGELCAKYLQKGSKVCVVGRVSVRTWETETKHGASLEVNLDDIEFLSGRQTPSDPSGFERVEPDDLPY